MAMKALEGQTGIQLEDPHITRLHEVLVQNGDFVGAEKFIEQSVQGKIPIFLLYLVSSTEP